jgi:hypothetical protein
MDHSAASAFVADWAQAWNEHDLERLLSHFTDDVVFTSPVAVHLLGGDGSVHGKDALREYWRIGLERIPDLHFEVLDTFAGVETIVIRYRNQIGGVVSEVLIFDGHGLVREGHGTYLGQETNPAGTGPAT